MKSNTDAGCVKPRCGSKLFMAAGGDFGVVLRIVTSDSFLYFREQISLLTENLEIRDVYGMDRIVWPWCTWGCNGSLIELWTLRCRVGGGCRWLDLVVSNLARIGSVVGLAGFVGGVWAVGGVWKLGWCG